MREAIIAVGICLGSLAAAAMIVIGPQKQRELSDCTRLTDGAQLVVYSDTRQMPVMNLDGTDGVLDANGPEWRCKPRPE